MDEKENQERKERFIRFLKIGAAAAFALLLLGSMVYRFIEARRPRPYTIILMMRHANVPVKHVFDRIEREFNESHDDVKFKVLWGDADAKLPLLVAARRMPDIWEIANFEAATKQHLLIDLEPFVKRDWQEIDGDDFFPELLEGCRAGGRLLQLPRWYNVPVLAYRPSHFKEAGLDPPDESWTWEDFARAGRALTRRDENGNVTRWGCDTTYGWWQDWITCVVQAGGRMFDPETGDVVLDTPEAVVALTEWSRRAREGWAPGPDDQAGTRFRGGQYSMSVRVSVLAWRALREMEGFDWDIAPLPKGPVGRVAGEMAIAAMGITRDCKNREAAWEVLKLLTGKRAAVEYCRAGYVPVRKSAAEEEFLKGEPSEREPPQNREALLTMLRVARPTPTHPRFVELSQDYICPRLQKMLRDGETNVAEVASAVTRECNDVLKVTRNPDEASLWWLVPQLALLAVAGVFAIRFYLRRTGAQRQKQRTGKLLGRRNVVLLGFICPWIVGFILLVAGPMIFSFFIAQTDYVVGKPVTYVGPGNYWNLFASEPDFWGSLGRTATYSIFAVPLKLVIALTAAVLLNIAFVRGIGLFRTIFFLPSLLPVAASTLMWMFLMDKRRGLFNHVIGMVGIEGQGWFTDPSWALWALIFVSLWAFGGAMLIFPAGLQDVPRSLHEAAMIDGAGARGRFRHVTVPVISPVIFFNLVMGVIGAMQIFAVAYILGGAAGAAGKAL